MEAYCEKYRRRLSGKDIRCGHPSEYCKFRSSCIAHFIGRDKAESEEVKSAPDTPEKQVAGAGTKKEYEMEQLCFEKGGGLLPAIVQDHETGEILMLAYINELAWQKTLETGKAHYWSRSRNKIWLKGESSGHVQLIREIFVDCDLDTVVFKVEQLGGAACHKGYRSCFFRKLEDGGWQVTGEPVFDPKEVYK